MAKKREYVVNVGNIGNIQCENRKAGYETFNVYVSLSNMPDGRASGEDVTLMMDGEPIKEYFGSLHDSNED